MLLFYSNAHRPSIAIKSCSESVMRSPLLQECAYYPFDHTTQCQGQLPIHTCILGGSHSNVEWLDIHSKRSNGELKPDMVLCSLGHTSPSTHAKLWAMHVPIVSCCWIVHLFY